MKKLKMKTKELSFGDEYWQYTAENERKIWEQVPLKFLKGIKNKKILEVGSGYGIYLYYLSENNKVIGIEIDRKRIEASKVNMKRLRRKAIIVQGDARKLPYKDASFDLVFCHGVIEHFPESERAVNEGYRVLREKGIAMYSVPARISFFVPLKILQKVIDKIFGTNFWTCGYEKSFTTWKFKKMLKSAGFKTKHFEINQTSSGERYPLIGKILRVLDKPFWLMKIGGTS